MRQAIMQWKAAQFMRHALQSRYAQGIFLSAHEKFNGLN